MTDQRPAGGRSRWLVIALVAVVGLGAVLLTTTVLSNTWNRGQISLVDRFGRQVDPLVLHFDGTPLPLATRDEIVAGVSGINAGSPG